MYFSPYTTKTTEEIFKQWQTGPAGLTVEAAVNRLAKYGPNQLASQAVRWWQILLRQFKSPFIYLLFGAAVLAMVMEALLDGLMIVAFVLINAVLQFIQEYHSDKALRLLKKLVVAQAHVKRGDKEILIDSSTLVPGDVVKVATGDLIPADLRFFKVNNLAVDESILSGESAPSLKQAESLASEAKGLATALNLGFSGTTVVGGQAEGIVMATAKNTIIGELAGLTSATVHQSSFEKGIARFSRFILRMILVILILLFVVNLLIKGRDANLTELLLFSIALAVSVIPEALPVVTTLSLSRGALKLAKSKVVVKRLSAVEDLGSVEVLCTDKTGTLTENKLKVASIFAQDENQCLFYAALASSWLGETKHEPNNAFDLALWEKISTPEKDCLKAYERLSEVPFSPTRRKNSVLVKEPANSLLVVRGALEEILRCSSDVSQPKRQEVETWAAAEGLAGHRVIAAAFKNCSQATSCSIEDEKGLTFLGAISFIDPIKSSTKAAVKQAKDLGVRVKILTGDSKEVAGAVAKEVGLIANEQEVITGEALEKMTATERLAAVHRFDVFARVAPQEKYQIIELLQKDQEVGFLGEGINDAPALKLANVALVVEGAADIAREAADIVLLNRSLAVIIEGIRGGREVFANTLKYLKITLISNFGNFYAIAIVSLIITFLPMLPVQILLLNLLSDFPMIAIATDTVDPAERRRPRSYKVNEVVLMAIILGLVSTVFDFIFFVLFYKHSQSALQTNWFIGSVLTELVLIYSVRTRLFCLKAKRPSGILIGLSFVAIFLTIVLPQVSFGQRLFKFKAPSSEDFLIIFAVVAAYFLVTEVIKLVYYRLVNNHEDRPDPLSKAITLK